MKPIRRYGLRRCETAALTAELKSLLVARGATSGDAHRADSLDLTAWGRRYLPHCFTAPPSIMHGTLAARLDAADRRRGLKLNVIGPRGGAKSTLGTLAHVLRAVVERREPYVWIVSDTGHQAANHLDNLKAELLDNPRLADDYPEAVGRGSAWRRHHLQARNGVVVEAFGAGMRMRGRRVRESRPTLIVCDDLQNDHHADSAEQRAASSRWFHGTLLKAGSQRTNVVNLATALHRDALALELHRTPGWESYVFPAVLRWPDATEAWDRWESIYCDLGRPEARDAARAFYDEHRTEMDLGAELLWPEVESLYDLMCMRVESGRTTFEREKQGVPINPQSCEWPESYFGDDLWFDEWPERLRVRTLALDPSKGTDARHGDYSAFVMLGIDGSGLVYVEADLARRPTPQIVDDGLRWCETFRPDAFGIEANHFQELLGDEFEREASARGRATFAPWTIANHVPKGVRIRRLGPLLARRKLRFRASSASTRLLVNQLRDFPCGDHDDGPDALEMAYRLAMELSAGTQNAER